MNLLVPSMSCVSGSRVSTIWLSWLCWCCPSASLFLPNLSKRRRSLSFVSFSILAYLLWFSLISLSMSLFRLSMLVSCSYMCFSKDNSLLSLWWSSFNWLSSSWFRLLISFWYSMICSFKRRVFSWYSSATWATCCSLWRFNLLIWFFISSVLTYSHRWTSIYFNSSWSLSVCWHSLTSLLILIISSSFWRSRRSCVFIWISLVWSYYLSCASCSINLLFWSSSSFYCFYICSCCISCCWEALPSNFCLACGDYWYLTGLLVSFDTLLTSLVSDGLLADWFLNGFSPSLVCLFSRAFSIIWYFFFWFLSRSDASWSCMVSSSTYCSKMAFCLSNLAFSSRNYFLRSSTSWCS